MAKHYFVREIQLKLCGFLLAPPANKRQVVPNQNEKVDKSQQGAKEIESARRRE